MEIKVEGEKLIEELQNTPLLLLENEKQAPQTQEIKKKTLLQQAISQTFESTAHLANLLPTGTVLAFQLLSPVFTNQGNCDPVSRTMSASLVILCALSTFLFSFTDSFRDKDGSICYGFATIHGLWVIDGSTVLPSELAQQYRLKFIDFFHSILSLLVFTAVALFDENVVHCFWPAPSDEAQEVLTALPVGIGVICSMLFVVFPTTRHGIGFPLSKTESSN